MAPPLCEIKHWQDPRIEIRASRDLNIALKKFCRKLEENYNGGMKIKICAFAPGGNFSDHTLLF
jgi:hypothetical protein